MSIRLANHPAGTREIFTVQDFLRPSSAQEVPDENYKWREFVNANGAVFCGDPEDFDEAVAYLESVNIGARQAKLWCEADPRAAFHVIETHNLWASTFARSACSLMNMRMYHP